LAASVVLVDDEIRCKDRVKVKNSTAPAVKREAGEN